MSCTRHKYLRSPEETATGLRLLGVKGAIHLPASSSTAFFDYSDRVMAAEGPFSPRQGGSDTSITTIAPCPP